MADKKQRLVSSILEFLTDSMEDGSIKQDDKEGIEVAIQCIGEAFGVDVSDEAQKKQLSVKPTTLAQIFDVYLKTEAKRGAAGPSASKAAPAATPAASTAASSGSSSSKEPSAADIAAADKLKGEGNQLMAGKKFAEAIEKYTLAIEKNPSNPVYYSNRAAAHSQAGDHESAIEDAMSAREIDENYTKAYSRMGHAYFSLGRYGEAVTAYEKGVELEPSNASMKASLATARQKAGEGSGSVASPRSPPAAGAGGNPFAGLGGGAGGMPDLASLMSNPQLMQAAQQMMGNGGLESLMQNPMLRQMAERFGQGGGMPDMNTLMSDPTIRQMAEQFGRGAGGGGSSSGNNNNGNNPDMYS